MPITKLEVINRVLQEAGERAVSSTTESSAALKVSGMLYSVLNLVNVELPWDDLLRTETLNSPNITTSASPAILNNLVGYKLGEGGILQVVQVHNTATNIPVMYAEWHTLQNLGYAVSDTPSAWTYHRGRLYTYPQVTTPSRSNYAVLFTGGVPVPADDSDEFEAPDYLVELYIKRLLFQFAQRHIGNLQFTTAIYQEYATELLKYAEWYKTTPVSLRSSYAVPNVTLSTAPIAQ